MNVFETNYIAGGLDREIALARKEFCNADPLDVVTYNAAEAKLKALRAMRKELGLTPARKSDHE